MNLLFDYQQWSDSFKVTYGCIEKIIPKISFGLSKISLILSNLQKFKTSFELLKNKFNPTIGPVLFEFLQTCSAFISFCSEYTKENFLSYFLMNSINQQYKDLELLWKSWELQSTSLFFDTFKDINSLYYAHYLDIIQIGKTFSSLTNTLPIPISNAINNKIDDIKLIISELSSYKDKSMNGIIQHQQFQIIKQIGVGAYAKVSLATFKPTKESIAIKELKLVQLGYRNILSLQRELDALLKLNHPNILQFIGVTVTPPFCIATKYVGNGSLYEILHSKKVKLTNIMKLKIATGMARGLEYLAEMRYIHRDFKSQNVLLDQDYNAIICDFGISRIIGMNMTTELGTVQWTAPEVLIQSTNPYTVAADTYSYGVVLWEMVTEKLPYYSMSSVQVAALVYNQNIRPEIPNDTPKSIESLIRSCWDRKPGSRPKMSIIREKLENGVITFGDTNMKEFKEWVMDTKPKHLQILKQASEFHRKEADSIVKKIHSLDPLDPITPKVLQQLYQIDYPLSIELFHDLLSFMSQTISIKTQSIAFGLFKTILNREDLIDIISPEQVIDEILPLINIQPQYVETSIKIIAERISNIENMIKKFLSLPQSYGSLNAIISLIESNYNRIPISLILKIFNQLHGQYLIVFFSSMMEIYGPISELEKISYLSITTIGIFLRYLSKMTENNHEKVIEIIGIDEIKNEKKSSLRKHLERIAIALVNQSVGISLIMGNIIFKYIITNCLKYNQRGPIVPLLYVLSRSKTLCTSISHGNFWDLIIESIKTENMIYGLKLIESLKIPQKSILETIWAILINTYIKYKNKEIAHTISYLLSNNPFLDHSLLDPILIEGFTNENEEFCISAFKIVKSYNEKSLLKLINETLFEKLLEQIQRKKNKINRVIGKFIVYMIKTIENFECNPDYYANILNYIYEPNTSFEAAQFFIVFLVIASKEPLVMDFLIKRYFHQYIEQLPFRYENNQKVDWTIDVISENLSKNYAY